MSLKTHQVIISGLLPHSLRICFRTHRYIHFHPTAALIAAPLVIALTLFVWICTILLYCTGMVLGLAALVVAVLGVAVLLTYSPQNGIILLVIAFLISPMGLPTAAAWLLGKVQDLRYAIQDKIYR